MKKIISYTVLVIVILLGLTFAVMNAEQVRLDFYLGEASMPLSLILVMTLALGAVLGALSLMGHIMGLKREIHRLRKQIKVTEKEVKNLRTMPIKDKH